MMRRWAYESDPRRAVADTRNGFIHLASGQFAPLTRLRALGNFDLQFVGVREVPDGHPKPARGNLLDRRALGITVGQWIKPLRIFAAFAGITLAAQTVHRNREALVCLGRDGAEAPYAEWWPMLSCGSRIQKKRSQTATLFFSDNIHSMEF